MLGRSIRTRSDLSSLCVHYPGLAGDFIDSKTRHHLSDGVFPLQCSNSVFVIYVLQQPLCQLINVLALTWPWLGGESSDIVLVVVKCQYHEGEQNMT